MTVNADERGMPLSFSSGNSVGKRAGRKIYEVVAMEDMWKINDEWWRGPEMEIERVYFRARLTDGRPVTLFHNLATDAWFRQ